MIEGMTKEEYIKKINKLLEKFFRASQPKEKSQELPSLNSTGDTASNFLLDNISIFLKKMDQTKPELFSEDDANKELAVIVLSSTDNSKSANSIREALRKKISHLETLQSFQGLLQKLYSEKILTVELQNTLIKIAETNSFQSYLQNLNKILIELVPYLRAISAEARNAFFKGIYETTQYNCAANRSKYFDRNSNNMLQMLKGITAILKILEKSQSGLSTLAIAIDNLLLYFGINVPNINGRLSGKPTYCRFSEILNAIKYEPNYASKVASILGSTLGKKFLSEFMRENFYFNLDINRSDIDYKKITGNVTSLDNMVTIIEPTHVAKLFIESYSYLLLKVDNKIVEDIQPSDPRMHLPRFLM